MNSDAWHSFFLGWLIFGGGVVGYTKAGSLPSLIAGIILGGALLTATYLLLNNNRIGLYVAAGTTALVWLKFAPEFKTSGDLFPAGLLAAVSTWVLGAFIVNEIDRLDPDESLIDESLIPDL
jgi:uncharacterized membrane protein (UPF0136 family)